MKKLTITILSVFILMNIGWSQCNLACNSLLHVSLSETGYAVITWDMMTEGSVLPCNPDDLTVTLEDSNGNQLSEPIVGISHNLDTITATVTNVDGTSCWGRIVVEDKLERDCVDTVYIDIATTLAGSKLTAALEVEDFNNIASMQFTVNYDSTKLNFTGVENINLLGFNIGSINESPSGDLRMLWFDPNAQSQTIVDGNSLFDLNFDVIAEGESYISISGYPLEIEISNSAIETLCLNSKPEKVGMQGEGGECSLVCESFIVGKLTSNSSVKLFVESFLASGTTNCNASELVLTTTDENGNIQSSTISQTFTVAGEYDYTIEDPSTGTSCSGLLTIEDFNTGCILACNSFVNVSLDNNGEAEITWDMIAEGSLSGCNTNELFVTLEDQNGNTIDPPVATTAHVGQTLIATVTESSSGNACWGEVFIVNKNCELSCLGLVTALIPQSGQLVVFAEDFIQELANCDYTQLSLVLEDGLGVTYTGNSSVTLTNPGLYEVNVHDPITGNSCTSSLRILGESNAACIDTISLELVASQVADEVALNLISTNFNLVQTAQFSISYNTNSLSYRSAESVFPGFSGGNINANNPGKLGLVWFDQTGVTPFSNPDGSVLMSFKFGAFANANVDFSITNDPVEIEFTDGQGNIYCLSTEAINIDVNGDAEPCVLACNNEINVSVSTGGSIEITPDMVLEGGPYDQCGIFEVEVTDIDGNVIPSSPFITGFGSNEEYNYTVTQLTTGNTCWGSISAVSFNQGECVDTLFLDLQSVFDGEKVRLDIKAYNFDNIVSMQFAIKFDEEVLAYEDLISGQLPGLFGSSFNAVDGDLLFAWNDPNINGVSLPDGTTIISLSFSALQNANTSFSIGETDWLKIEIVNSDFQLLCLADESNEVLIDGAHYYGYIIFDENLNCEKDNDENGLNDWFITLDNGTNVFNFDTDDSGYYSMVVPPGSYTISAHAPNALWTFCENNINAVTQSNDDFYEYDFLALPEQDCPYMTVDISTPFLRRCFDNKYYLKYCNKGTQTATGSSIIVDLDKDISFVSTAHLDYDVNGGQIEFNLGDVGIGECETISFTVNVSCDSEMGQTHCTQARVFPEPDCMDAFSSWDGPTVEVEGSCDQDSVKFLLRNGGSSAMVQESSFIVIEDDVMFPIKDFQLEPSEELQFAYPRNGSTYRIMAYQVDNHPSSILPTVAIEGCGFDNDGNFSTGFVNMFENGDGDEYIDIDCQENIGSYDPNDKAGFPKGYRSENLILNDTKLEYKIRFQNTGTDTAFRVVVTDTLSEKLDLISIELGTSSHNYTFSLVDSRILVFTFDNIKLVSEKEDEPNSHGFVKYKVNQVDGNVDGTRIFNKADIYFDFNDPVLTNQTDHVIGSDFVETIVSTINIVDPNLEMKIFPNPFSDFAIVELKNINLNESTFEVYNVLGVLVKRIALNKQSTKLNLEDLLKGAYFFTVNNNNQRIATGKLIRE